MILSNFSLTRTKGSSPLNWEYFAEVDVTTGLFWWKKVKRRKIRREFAKFWHFVDTGEFTPLGQVESLERAFEAQQGLKLWERSTD